MAKKAFDNDQYLLTQSAHIRERIAQFGGKLYLEFGGKLYDDNHAARVLPGFQPDSKLRMLLQLKEQVEVVIAINADDIEKNKIRGDLGITYDRDDGMRANAVAMTDKITEMTSFGHSGSMYLPSLVISLPLLAQLRHSAPGEASVRPHLGQTESCFS